MAPKSDPKATANVKIDPNMDVLNFSQLIGDNVENKLKFKPRLEDGNLCIGRLVSAEVVMRKQEVNDKNGLPSTWEYAGCTIPNLELTFIQEPTNTDPAERVYKETFSIFTNVTKAGEAVDRATILSKYQEDYKKLRHIANAFTTMANYDKTAVIADLNPFSEDVNARIESVTKYYQSWANLFQGKDGKGFSGQKCRMKLIASPTGTYLCFPRFVGEGFIEKFIAERKATIELKPSESVELVKKEATKRTGGAKTDAAETPAVSDDVAALVAKYSHQG